MKICVTSQGDTLDAMVDSRFGRCSYFVIVDTDTMNVEAIENPHVAEMQGVGIRAGQLMVQKKVQVVLTGNVGPNAAQTLQAAGIQTVVDLTGPVKEVIAKFQKGEIPIQQGPAKKETQ